MCKNNSWFISKSKGCKSFFFVFQQGGFVAFDEFQYLISQRLLIAVQVTFNELSGALY